jgi:hypothetical protein
MNFTKQEYAHIVEIAEKDEAIKKLLSSYEKLGGDGVGAYMTSLNQLLSGLAVKIKDIDFFEIEQLGGDVMQRYKDLMDIAIDGGKLAVQVMQLSQPKSAATADKGRGRKPTPEDDRSYVDKLADKSRIEN